MNRVSCFLFSAGAVAVLVLVSACGGEVRSSRVVVENVTVTQQKTVVVENAPNRPAVVTNSVVENAPSNPVVVNNAVTAASTTVSAPVTVWVTNFYTVHADEKVLEMAKRLSEVRGDKRMAIARERIPGNYFTVLQTAWILSSIAEDEERYVLLKMLAPQVIDLEHRDYLINGGHVPWMAPVYWKAIDFVTNLVPVSGVSVTNGNVITNFVTVQSIHGRRHDFSTISEDEVWHLTRWLSDSHGDKRLNILRDRISGNNLTVFQAAQILTSIAEEDNYYDIFHLIASHVIDFENRDYLSDRIPSGNHSTPRIKNDIQAIQVSDSDSGNASKTSGSVDNNTTIGNASDKSAGVNSDAQATDMSHRQGRMNSDRMATNVSSSSAGVNVNASVSNVSDRHGRKNDNAQVTNVSNKPVGMNVNAQMTNASSSPAGVNVNASVSNVSDRHDRKNDNTQVTNVSSKPVSVNVNTQMTNVSSKPASTNVNAQMTNASSKPVIVNVNAQMTNVSSKPVIVNVNTQMTNVSSKPASANVNAPMTNVSSRPAIANVNTPVTNVSSKPVGVNVNAPITNGTNKSGSFSTNKTARNGTNKSGGLNTNTMVTNSSNK